MYLLQERGARAGGREGGREVREDREVCKRMVCGCKQASV